LCRAGSPETKPWLDLLKLFAFGTYAEYKANSANLPQLDDAQALKLKQLTIVSLAADSKVIPYETLLAALDLSDTRTLEDCIIEGMYAGLLAGKLDQKTKEFHVTETAGRDVKPGEIADMISALKAWVEVCASLCHGHSFVL
jgi:COP9 signalosome complex subunit 7